MNQVQSLLRKLYRGVGTSRAKRLSGLLERGEWARIQSEEMSLPHAYHSADAYLRDALVVEITRKLLLPGDDAARDKLSFERWLAAEQQCARTNARLKPFINGGPFGLPDLQIQKFITSWRRNMRRVLGKASFWMDIHYSSGATLSDAGKLTTIPDKMSSVPTVYRPSLQIWRDHARWTVHEAHEPSIVRSNRYFTVPKDSKVNRACCVEASGSLALQLAVGRRLKALYRKRYQVDLTTAQKQVHRTLAKAGSETGEWATIDLSNASDTVARELIRLIVPADWWELLNSLRAPTTSVDGRVYWLEKFSSMGNGFTFELETLVFRTLLETLGIPRDQAFVYGDDIIVPVQASASVLAALGYFGFTPNAKKTFCEGPFRESCGGDYFYGTPVRAHYMKRLPDEPQQWMALANGLRRADPTFRYVRSAWRYCIDQVPTAWRVFGPERLGDVVFHDDAAVPIDRVFKHRNHDGTVESVTLPAYAVMVPVARTFELWKHFEWPVALAATLRGCDRLIGPRGAIQGYRRSYIPAYGVSDPEQVWQFLPRQEEAD